MSENLFLRFPIEVTLALLALVPILLAVARVLIALRRPVPVRMPGAFAEAPYKLEAPGSLAGQLDVVPQAGREPANR
jgi:hypothetical protein